MQLSKLLDYQNLNGDILEQRMEMYQYSDP